MPSFEPFVYADVLSKDLLIAREARKVYVDVKLDFDGYYELCRRTYEIMRGKLLTWYPTEEVPLTSDQFMSICVALLIKRIEYVRTEELSEDYTRTGIGKAILIPAPIFTRLYMYGYVDVGGDRYLPTTDGILEWAAGKKLNVAKSKTVDAKTVYQFVKPTESEKQLWAAFNSDLSTRMVMSEMLPKESAGSPGMLFHVVSAEGFNRPYSLTENASPADAVLAAMSPDKVTQLKKRKLELKMTKDIISFLFTVPYTTLEAPDDALTTFILAAFRGVDGPKQQNSKVLKAPVDDGGGDK